MKKCIRCDNKLPSDYFYNRKGKKDKVCKPCRKFLGNRYDNKAPWADYSKIWELYYEATRLTIKTGVSHTVDHIVPKEGYCVNVHVVSGLHCEDNLEVLTMVENSKKGKTKWPDQPDYPDPLDRMSRIRWRNAFLDEQQEFDT